MRYVEERRTDNIEVTRETWTTRWGDRWEWCRGGGCRGLVFLVAWDGWLPIVNLSLTSPEVFFFTSAEPRQWHPLPDTAVVYCCSGDRTPFETRICDRAGLRRLSGNTRQTDRQTHRQTDRPLELCLFLCLHSRPQWPVCVSVCNACA